MCLAWRCGRLRGSIAYPCGILERHAPNGVFCIPSLRHGKLKEAGLKVQARGYPLALMRTCNNWIDDDNPHDSNAA